MWDLSLDLLYEECYVVFEYTFRSVTNQSAEVKLKLSLAVARLHLDDAVQFWCTHYGKGTDNITRKKNNEWQNDAETPNLLPCKERLGKLDLHSLERLRLQGHFTKVFK